MTREDFIDLWLAKLENTIFIGFFSCKDDEATKYRKMDNAHKMTREKLRLMLDEYDQLDRSRPAISVTDLAVLNELIGECDTLGKPVDLKSFLSLLDVRELSQLSQASLGKAVGWLTKKRRHVSNGK